MFRSISRLRAVVTLPISCKRYAHAPVALNWQDPLDSASLFTSEELAIQETARSYCQERLLPRVLSISFTWGSHSPPYNEPSSTKISFSQTLTEAKTMTRSFFQKWAPWVSSAQPSKAMDAQVSAVSPQGSSPEK